MYYGQCQIPSTEITCQRCGYQFSLEDAPGAAFILCNGQFVGECPHCGYVHESKNKVYH